MNYAEQIKSRLTAREVFEFYGLTVNRGGFCLCPFHSEKTPSMKVFPGDRGFKCFGCGKGGDILDFVKDYFGLSFPDAVAKLNEDFNLGFPIGKQLPTKEQLEATKKANERKREQTRKKKQLEDAEREYDELLSLYISYDTIKRDLAPKSSADGFSDVFAYALKHIDEIVYKLSLAEAKLFLLRNPEKG